MKRPSFFGELEISPTALEQPHTETGLQFRHPPGQGRLGARRGTCGAPEPAMPGDEVEIDEREKIHLFHQ